MAKRYIFAVMAMLSLVVSFMLRACLSLALTQMVAKTNSTTAEIDKMHWDEVTQGAILSSFYWGYIITHIPGGLLAEKFGGKSVVGWSLLITSVSTLMTPWSVHYGSAFLIAVRFVEGFSEGVMFPALYILLAQWAPYEERGTISTMTLMGGQIGSFLANAVGGVILSYCWSWHSIFYFFGWLSVFFSFLWYFLCYSNPDSHPHISDTEKHYLRMSIGSTMRRKDLASPPWRSILTSAAVWALIIADCGHHWGFFTIITYLPKYMNDVLKVKPLQNGIASGLPFLTVVVVAWLSGAFSDFILRRKIISTTASVRKTYTTISNVGPSIGVIAASYCGYDAVAVTLLFIFGMACMAFSYSSLKLNALELSPNYSGTLTGLSNGAGCIPGMVVPYFVGLLTPDKSLEEWRLVFWMTAAAMVISNLVFVLFGSCELEKWNEPNVQKKDAENLS